MSSGTSIQYVTYELFPKHYVIRPDLFIRCCPECGGTLSKASIPPSKAATRWLTTATIPYHMFSHLYECPACHWWAVWESFGDAEYSPDYHLLISSQRNEHPVSLDKPWSQALEDENVYDHDLPLTKSLEQVLVGGKIRILDLPKPGDKVRLVGDVHSLRDPKAVPFELIPLFIGGSMGTVVDDDELYDLIEAQHAGLEPRYLKNLVLSLKAELYARNCCPIRLEKLVVPPTGQSSGSCKKGEIYFIDAADIACI